MDSPTFLVLAALLAACALFLALIWRRLGAQAGLEARTLREGLAEAQRLLAAEQQKAARVPGLEAECQALRGRLETLAQAKAEVEAARAALAATLDLERLQAGEQLALLSQVRQDMGDRFRALADEVMTRHGETFSQQNRQQLEGALNPLRERLTDFQQALAAAHTESLRDRTTLAEQIRGLTESSAAMSSETRNLTRALQGESQVQGAWGELILGTILEKSGLREGEEFQTQEGHTAEDGTRVRPDVIVNLPAGEKIIIDSKVSLVAFRDYVNAGTEAERAAALQRHLGSLRAHIRGLGGKDYQLAAGSRLDYVLMFVPIEGALAAAIQADSELTSLAAECNVAIATPTTLMIALRTVANVWKVERRNKNAERIAERAGYLYDKFVGFVEDMQEIAKHLGRARDAHAEAMKKLSLGRGNLATQAEQLKALGARAAKALPEALLDEEAGEA